VPDPGYPVYHAGTAFAGGESVVMPLYASNAFLPDLKHIAPEHARRAKIMYLNYPNNPTAAVAPKAFLEEVVEFARRHNIIVCHDAAYSEIYYDGRRPASFLEVEGAKEVGIEFHSLSKTYNMTGWRIGFAVGHRQVLSALGKVKSNLDSGVFQAVQEAGITALNADDELTERLRKVYQERRDVLVPGLQKLGLDALLPQAAFYVWIAVPSGYSSAAFTSHLLEKAGIVTTPGNGFGADGEGYIRMTLTTSKERLGEAVERIRKVGF
jgi:LL-diaminopimelate aminotransferase